MIGELKKFPDPNIFLEMSFLYTFNSILNSKVMGETTDEHWLNAKTQFSNQFLIEFKNKTDWIPT